MIYQHGRAVISAMGGRTGYCSTREVRTSLKVLRLQKTINRYTDLRLEQKEHRWKALEKSFLLN